MTLPIARKLEQQLRDYQEHLEKLIEERTYELRESEEKFRNIFEDAVVGIYQSTPEGRFPYGQPCACLGCMDSRLRGTHAVRHRYCKRYLCRSQASKRFLIELAEADGIIENYEIQARTRDGSIKYLSVNAHTVKDENGKTLRYEGIIQDITDEAFW